MIVDEREILLMLPSMSTELNQLIGVIGIWSDHFGLAHLGATYFEFVWRESASEPSPPEPEEKVSPATDE